MSPSPLVPMSQVRGNKVKKPLEGQGESFTCACMKKMDTNPLEEKVGVEMKNPYPPPLHMNGKKG